MEPVADGASSASEYRQQFRRAVVWLWWGGILSAFSVGPIALAGMTLVTVVCLRLQAMEPPSGWGPTSSVLAIVVTLGIAGTMLVDDPRLEPLVLTMGTIGIMAVTWRLADIAETLVEPLLAHRWVLAAKWQVASACVLGLFIGVAEAAGSLESDPDAVFEWAIASPVSLVALILFMAVGVLASGFWLRAAWVTWRTLD